MGYSHLAGYKRRSENLEPKIQAKAMLAKMVLRGCTPNKGPGKSLLDTECSRRNSCGKVSGENLHIGVLQAGVL